MRVDDESFIQVEKPRSYQAIDQIEIEDGAIRKLRAEYSQVMLWGEVVRKIRRVFYLLSCSTSLKGVKVISFIFESYYNNSLSSEAPIMFYSPSRESGPLPVPQWQVGNKGKCKGQLIPNIPASLPNHGSDHANVPGLHHAQNAPNDAQ